jgi:hypothetical protein
VAEVAMEDDAKSPTFVYTDSNHFWLHRERHTVPAQRCRCAGLTTGV